jgi:hypothetical protein
MSNNVENLFNNLSSNEMKNLKNSKVVQDLLKEERKKTYEETLKFLKAQGVHFHWYIIFNDFVNGDYNADQAQQVANDRHNEIIKKYELKHIKPI